MDKVRNLFSSDYDEDEYDMEDGYDNGYDGEYDEEPQSKSSYKSGAYYGKGGFGASDDFSDYSNIGSKKKVSNVSRLPDTQVIDIRTNVQMEVVIIKPTTYDDAQEISDRIKTNKPVVVNLEAVGYPEAQRIMDFLSGTCYSLEGKIQRVANNIFIIAPENVDISNDIQEELKTKGFSFLKSSEGGRR